MCTVLLPPVGNPIVVNKYVISLYWNKYEYVYNAAGRFSDIFWQCSRGMYRLLVGKPEGRNHWGDLGIDGRIILERISRRWDVGIWTGLGWPRIETGGGRL